MTKYQKGDIIVYKYYKLLNLKTNNTDKTFLNDYFFWNKLTLIKLWKN